MTPDHPRPTLVRSEYTLLDGPWGFAVDAEDRGLPDRWFDTADPFDRTILVPFPPEAPASGICQDVDAPLWYRREFAHSLAPGQRLLLHFEGVDHLASVWVNGIHVGEHEGSQAGFTVDVTDAVRPGANVLVVRAVDEVRDLEQPRGKQDWCDEPHVIWYRRTSGIWRTVWLEPVPAARIDRLHLRPGEDLASVVVEARLAGVPGEGATMGLRFGVGDRLLADVTVACVSSMVRAVVPLVHESLDAEPGDLLWSPESPTLIDVEATLRLDGAVVDRVESYLGLRTVGTDEENVLLNGHPYFLRMVLVQGYWPQTHLAAPSFAALEQEARLIKKLGFNGLRMHQTSADPRFLACCDRLGLLVWADIAATYRFSDVALTRTVAEAISLVERDAAHPSVVAWVPYNESWGVPRLAEDPAQQHAVAALHALLKALDPTRIAMGNDGWQFTVGDVVGVHDYAQHPGALDERYGSRERVRATVATGHAGGRRITLPGFLARAAKVPVLLSEFGGISVHDDAEAWAAYGDVIEPDHLAAAIAGLVATIRPGNGIAGYCYTQLTDTAQEKNGLLTEDRVPKEDPERIRAAFVGAGRHASSAVASQPRL
jgi:beta-galactosidase/beta-glucuronidase